MKKTINIEQLNIEKRMIQVFLKRNRPNWSYWSFDKNKYKDLLRVLKVIGSYDFSTIDIHYGTGCADTFCWCDIEWNNGMHEFKTSERVNDDEQNLKKAMYASIIDFVEWYNKIFDVK